MITNSIALPKSFNNSLYQEEDFFTYDFSKEEQNQTITFDQIGKIFIRSENDSIEKENEEEQRLYFLNEKSNSNSFLGKKKNNKINIEDNQETESKKLIVEIKKDSKDTKESTGENPNLKKIIKFVQEKDSKKKRYRNDYYIKKFKKDCFSNYTTHILNSMLKACQFSKNLGLSKIYMPNSEAFTSETNLRKNKEFLSMSIKAIYSLEEGKGQYQKANAAIFDDIFTHEKNAKNKEAYCNIIQYLNKTGEDVIREYYNSEAFDQFKENMEIKEYDEAFKREKKFSLLEDLGFLKLIRGEYS